MNIIKIIALSIGVIILLCVFTHLINPLAKSEEKITEKLFKETPIGTNMEDVIKYVNSHDKWKVEKISYENGFHDQRGTSLDKFTGTKHIEVNLGNYRTILNAFFETNVTVFWGFDENSKLIDIWVWKVTDGL